MAENDMARPDGPGSREPSPGPAVSAASGFDPSREPFAINDDGLDICLPREVAVSAIGRKAAHVRAAADPGGHHCHWPGCTRQVKPAMWGCRAHWYALPLSLRSRIWKAYRPGQEDSKTPSRSYLDIAREAQAWIAEHHPETHGIPVEQELPL